MLQSKGKANPPELKSCILAVCDHLCINSTSPSFSLLHWIPLSLPITRSFLSTYPSESCLFFFIGRFHFPVFLLPLFCHPIFPLVPYQDPLPVRVLFSLATSNTRLASFQQMSLEEAKASSGMAIQVHQQNTQNQHTWISTQFCHQNLDPATREC